MAKATKKNKTIKTQQNKENIKNLTPFLEKAIYGVFAQFSFFLSNANNIENTARMMLVNSYKSPLLDFFYELKAKKLEYLKAGQKDVYDSIFVSTTEKLVKDIYNDAHIFELRFAQQKLKFELKNNWNNVIEKEFKNIILFPITFEELKKLLFFKQRNQTIKGKIYRNMNDVVKILLGLSIILQKHFDYKQATLREIFFHPEYCFALEKFTLDELKEKGASFERGGEIPPVIFLCAILIFQNYWNIFVK